VNAASPYSSSPNSTPPGVDIVVCASRLLATRRPLLLSPLATSPSLSFELAWQARVSGLGFSSEKETASKERGRE